MVASIVFVSTSKYSDIRAEIENLPFQKSSIDLVVLVHSLEINKNPHAVFREINRILVDDGEIIITCFNKMSFIGLFNYLPIDSIFKNKSYISIGRLEDWSKLFSYECVRIYREAYGIFATNGILFNHESPRRGETFVTKKIVNALCNIKLGNQKKLYLGNLDSKRDWGHAKDYVEAMWKILQQKKPDDYVIATGKQYSVRQFVNLVSKKLGFKIVWRGKGKNEKGIDQISKKTIVECNEKYFRPLDVNTLLGDAKKARKILKWKPKINITQLVDDMISQEMISLEKND